MRFHLRPVSALSLLIAFALTTMVSTPNVEATHGYDSFQTFLSPSPGIDDQFGYSVSYDDGRLVIGEPHDSTAEEEAGAAFIFDAKSGQLLHTLLNPDPDPPVSNDIYAFGDYFGESVAIDGGYLIVGASNDKTMAFNGGAAYVFNVTTGQLLHTLFPPAPVNDYAKFGEYVSIDGDKALIGAGGVDSGSLARVGRAYLYDVSTGSLLHTFQNPTPYPEDRFGSSVSIRGNTAVIGAPQDDNAMGYNAGAAYLFDAVSGSLVWTLLPPTRVWDRLFGTSVWTSGGNVVVGAPYDKRGTVVTGAAYIFDSTTGLHTRTILNPTPEDGDNFGDSVSVFGDQVLVGAPSDDEGALNSGAAYLFDAASGSLLQTFLNPTPGIDDQYGKAVSNYDGVVVIGAWYDSTLAFYAGAAYLYPIVARTNTHPHCNETHGAVVEAAFTDSSADQGNFIVPGCLYPYGVEGTLGFAYRDRTSGQLLSDVPGLPTLANPVTVKSRYSDGHFHTTFTPPAEAVGKQILVALNNPTAQALGIPQPDYSWSFSFARSDALASQAWSMTCGLLHSNSTLTLIDRFGTHSSTLDPAGSFSIEADVGRANAHVTVGFRNSTLKPIPDLPSFSNPWKGTSNATGYIKASFIFTPTATANVDTVGPSTSVRVTVCEDGSYVDEFLWLHKNILPRWSTDAALSASSVTETRIGLSWSNALPFEVVSKYRIYHDTALLVELGNVTSYTVTGLTPGTAYQFTVEAGDVGDNWQMGPSVSVTTSSAWDTDVDGDGDVDSDDVSLIQSLTGSLVSCDSSPITCHADVDNDLDIDSDDVAIAQSQLGFWMPWPDPDVDGDGDIDIDDLISVHLNQFSAVCPWPSVQKAHFDVDQDCDIDIDDLTSVHLAQFGSWPP